MIPEALLIAQLERLAKLRAELQDPRALARLEKVERKARLELGKILGEARSLTDKQILASPAFETMQQRISDVLKKHPDALLAAAEGLEADLNR